MQGRSGFRDLGFRALGFRGLGCRVRGSGSGFRGSMFDAFTFMGFPHIFHERRPLNTQTGLGLTLKLQPRGGSAVGVPFRGIAAGFQHCLAVSRSASGEDGALGV